MIIVFMVVTFLLIMFGIHETVKYYAAASPYLTFIVGVGILVSIAYIVDRKEGYY